MKKQTMYYSTSTAGGQTVLSLKLHLC